MSEELGLAVIMNAPLVCVTPPPRPLHIKLWEPRSQAGITDTDGGVGSKTFGGKSRSGM